MISLTRFLISRQRLCFKAKSFFSDGITTTPDGRHSFFIIKVNENGDFLEYVYEFEGETITDCIEAFENSPIWDGKTFYNAESEMTWVDW